MKKFEIAYHNNAEAKCAHQVQKYFVQTQEVTLCVRSKQPHAIKTIIYNDIFTSLRRKKFEAWLNSSRSCSVGLVTSLH